MSERAPAGWENVTIKSIADPNSSYSLTGGPFGSNLKAEDYTENGVRIIQLQNIGDGEFLDDYKIYTSDAKADELKSCNIYPGDIILSKMGDPVARATIVPPLKPRYLMASDGIRLSVDKIYYDTEFIHYAINSTSFRGRADLSSTGTTRKRIGLTDLKELTLAVPKLPEQKKIASILTSVDEVIENIQKQVDKLQDLKKATMNELLTKGIGHTEFKDSELGRIPKSWKVKKLRELLDVDKKYPMRSGPFGSALLKEELVPTGIPFLGIDNVHVEEFRGVFKRFISKDKFNELAKYEVFPDDLVVTIMGTVGRCCIIPKDIPRAISSKHTWVISFNKELMLSYLVCWQVNHSTWVLKHFADNSQGGVMDSISSETLKNTLLPVPPMDEQRLMLRTYLEFEKFIKKLKIKLLQTESLKKSLMQDLLTGKIRVQVN